MKKLIGKFGVDSGQAMVGDPCYLDNWKNWNSEEQSFEDHEKSSGEYSYLGACNATIKGNYGVLGNGMSVVFTTGYGDGLYPVYAEIGEDGRVEKITIDFIGSEDYEEEEGDDSDIYTIKEDEEVMS